MRVARSIVITKLALLLAVFAALAWRVADIGLPALANSVATTPAAEPSVGEDVRLRRAHDLRQSNPDLAVRLLREIVWDNPSDGSAYVLLGVLAERDAASRAADLVTLGEKLSPQHELVRSAAAAFWARQGDLERALAGWNITLSERQSSNTRLYPLLTLLADNLQHRAQLRVLLKEPPRWWADFFVFLAARARHTVTVRTLFGWRELGGAGAPITADERAAFVARLQREQRWREAYFVWLNGLGPEHLLVLGNLYNGGFEKPVSNAGFGWRVDRATGVRVTTGQLASGRGQKALGITFSGRVARYRHLYQYLQLPHGRYQFSGFVRAVALYDQSGLQWVFRCGSGNRLAETRQFNGDMRWQLFRTEFVVPATECESQEIRLAVPATNVEATDGEVWFDDLALRRLNADQE